MKDNLIRKIAPWIVLAGISAGCSTTSTLQNNECYYVYLGRGFFAQSEKSAKQLENIEGILAGDIRVIKIAGTYFLEGKSNKNNNIELFYKVCRNAAGNDFFISDSEASLEFAAARNKAAKEYKE